MHSLQSLYEVLSAPTDAVEVTGVRSSAAALIAATVSEQYQQPALCVVPSEPQAATLCRDLSFFSSHTILQYPAHEIPPYTPLSPDQNTTAQRLSTLYQLVTATTPLIVVASIEALLRRILPKEVLFSLVEIVMRGEETDPEELRRYLVLAGYEQMSLVQNSGEFSVRGGIFDIFPAGASTPIRLDFFGDTIESMRSFDPISQRSIEEIEEYELIPASEILFPHDEEKTTTLLQHISTIAETYSWKRDERDVLREKVAERIQFPGIEFFSPLFYDHLDDPLAYFPDKGRIYWFEPLEIQKSIDLSWERINANYQESLRVQTLAFPPETLFVSKNEFLKSLERFGNLTFHEFSSPQISKENFFPKDSSRLWQLRSTNHQLIKQDIALQRKKHGLLPPLAHHILPWIEQGHQVHLCCRSARNASQLREMLTSHGIRGELVSTPFLQQTFSAESHFFIHPEPLSEGFDLPDEGLHFLSETELFGEKRLFSKKAKKKAQTGTQLSFEELHIGDIVVHDAHGLGVYRGIMSLECNAITNDFLHIEYHDNDKLYVPVDRIHSVSKYNGLSDKKPALSRLGSTVWQNTKKKAQSAVWEVAQNLLHLYARRQLTKGFTFSQPDDLFRELEESFPYNETDGQNQAIQDVLDDLLSERCMDRLVCGDVGFGKTEVAVRAAFKVVCDTRQVAILVPTTVLAEQHAQTFQERFEGFPVTVQCLNRFRSRPEQKKILEDLEAGGVDILIGTHRILSKDVRFKNLGLLIIDEEHRFGVTHKEKLKTLKTGIDVLTLTATPIPRTLQMSLLGVRDLSVISSPPRHRQSVKTFVAKYDDLVVKEAITRELQRGGQVFLVHNRVQSIHEVAHKVQELVPEARVSVAHGQMPGKVLEEIMVHFVQKKINVLICTTIIESGLDIPNANTIIITRADRLGLAEIYQLRGRVGRSSEQAFAYLLVPSLEHLSKDAKQRLRALMDYNELGGGFKLALSDLQIRGGGNILGESQSGAIAAVGYDLYLDLLQRTVEDLKRKQEFGDDDAQEDIPEPEVNLALTSLLSSSYVPDPNQRYIGYKRIAAVTTEEDLDTLREEFQDRYGIPPQEVQNLFAIVDLKLTLKQYKVMKLEQSPQALVFSFHPSTPIEPAQILSFIRKSKNRVRMTPDSRLVVSQSFAAPKEIFSAVKNTLHALMGESK